MNEPYDIDAEVWAEAAEEWARAHGRRLFLGEFNASQNDAYLPAVDNLLTHLESQRVGQTDGVWIGWAVWAVTVAVHDDCSATR